jgi:hypothetical protein
MFSGTEGSAFVQAGKWDSTITAKCRNIKTWSMVLFFSNLIGIS